jgi:hypothetical protein
MGGLQARKKRRHFAGGCLIEKRRETFFGTLSRSLFLFRALSLSLSLLSLFLSLSVFQRTLIYIHEALFWAYAQCVCIALFPPLGLRANKEGLLMSRKIGLLCTRRKKTRAKEDSKFSLLQKYRGGCHSFCLGLFMPDVQEDGFCPAYTCVFPRQSVKC